MFASFISTVVCFFILDFIFSCNLAVSVGTTVSGNIIAKGHNMVLKNTDPTSHAEIVAIRKACNKLNTIDLSNYILYTTCEPCPMCLSAIIWSNIKDVYYACTRNDAGEIGFRDDVIYEYLEGKKKNLLNIKQIDRQECVDLFAKYKRDNKIIY